MPKAIAVKKVAPHQQLQQVKAPAKTVVIKPVPKQAAPTAKGHPVKP